ncbi:peptidase M24, structural domain-containing protein [Cladochytrium replicatum]|nr:peptidase M24, structural domain-containing protein [Cladochytrium replicatum]
MFLRNREHLFGFLSDNVEGFSDGSVSIAIPSAPRLLRAESDMELNWHQSSNVLYLLGQKFNIGSAIIVLYAESSSLALDVYLPVMSLREVIFMGEQLTPEILVSDFFVKNVYTVAEFPAYAAGHNTLTTVSPKDFTSYTGVSSDGLERSIAAKESFVEARFYKSQEELELLKFASKLSAWVHAKMDEMITFNPQVSEIELASAFGHLSTICGGRQQGYPPIVGAGKDSAVLHFRTGENEEDGYTNIKAPNFVLIDAAAEFKGYSSDITRTYARKGEWTPEMKEVYSIVKAVQDACLKVYAPGVSFQFVNFVANVVMVDQLLRKGFLYGADTFTLLLNNAQSVFFPHGLGHPVGLDVHDPTPLNLLSSVSIASVLDIQVSQALPEPPTWLPETLRAEMRPYDYPIFPGHITTLEPGVYFVPLLLKSIKENPDGPGKFVNWTKIESGRYEELGGVRIEDVVMIDTFGRKEIVSRL